jgi:hypothetical protein
MTEAEWEACGTLRLLEQALGEKLSRRKDRLFAVACCRPIWDLMTHFYSRQAVEASERFAEDEAALNEMKAARGRVRFSRRDQPAYLAYLIAGESLVGFADHARRVRTEADLLVSGEQAEAEQVQSLRDIYGNPFRPVALNPSCITGDVRSLAQAAYGERILPSGHLDPARLGILADALEEAGATGEILTHMRSPGPHVRGCWAVDLILGKG